MRSKSPSRSVLSTTNTLAGVGSRSSPARRLPFPHFTARVLKPSHETIFELLEKADIEYLKQIVLDGFGRQIFSWRYVDTVNSDETKRFMSEIPDIQSSIERLHGAIILDEPVEALKQLITGSDRQFLLGRDRDGRTPLHTATLYDRRSLVPLLCQQLPLALRAADNNGRTPLHYAALTGNAPIYRLLVDSGAPTTVQDSHLRRPEDYLTDFALQQEFRQQNPIEGNLYHHFYRKSLGSGALKRSPPPLHPPPVILSPSSDCEKIVKKDLKVEKNLRKTSLVPPHNQLFLLNCGENFSNETCYDRWWTGSAVNRIPTRQRSQSPARMANQGTGRFNVRALIAEGNLDELEATVLQGYGDRLLGETSQAPLVQEFLDNLSGYLDQIADLHRVASRGNVREFQGILDRPSMILARDPLGATPLHKAVLGSHHDLVEHIVTNYGTSALDARDNDGRTPLHYAAGLSDDRAIYQLLVKAGAKTTIVDQKQKSAEFYLRFPDELNLNQIRLRSQRLNANYAINLQNRIKSKSPIRALQRGGKSPERSISPMGRGGQQRMSRSYHSMGALNHNGSTELDLEVASQTSNDGSGSGVSQASTIVKRTIGGGANSKYRHSNGNLAETQISSANVRKWISENNTDAFEGAVLDGCGEQVAEKAAKVLGEMGDATNGGAMSAIDEAYIRETVPAMMGKIQRIHAAVSLGDLSGLKSNVQKRPGYILSKDHLGMTPLHKATIMGHVDVVQYILEKFPETVNARDHEGRTALHYSTATTNKNGGRIYRMLIRAGADARVRDAHGKSADYYRVHLLALPSEVVRRPSGPNGASGGGPAGLEALNGGGVISSAVSSTYGQSNGILTEPKSRRVLPPVIRDKVATALHRGDVALLNELILDGFGPELLGRTAYGDEARKLLKSVATTLETIRNMQEAAVSGDHETLVKKLEAEPQWARVRDGNSFTLLHLAVVGGHLGLVNWLTQQYPQLLATKDSMSRTALHLAALTANVDIYRRLLELGLDYRSLDQKGKTAEYYLKNNPVVSANEVQELGQLAVSLQGGLGSSLSTSQTRLNRIGGGPAGGSRSQSQQSQVASGGKPSRLRPLAPRKEHVAAASAATSAVAGARSLNEETQVKSNEPEMLDEIMASSSTMDGVGNIAPDDEVEEKEDDEPQQHQQQNEEKPEQISNNGVPNVDAASADEDENDTQPEMEATLHQEQPQKNELSEPEAEQYNDKPEVNGTLNGSVETAETEQVVKEETEEQEEVHEPLINETAENSLIIEGDEGETGSDVPERVIIYARGQWENGGATLDFEDGEVQDEEAEVESTDNKVDLTPEAASDEKDEPEAIKQLDVDKLDSFDREEQEEAHEFSKNSTDSLNNEETNVGKESFKSQSLEDGQSLMHESGHDHDREERRAPEVPESSVNDNDDQRQEEQLVNDVTHENTEPAQSLEQDLEPEKQDIVADTVKPDEEEDGDTDHPDDRPTDGIERESIKNVTEEVHEAEVSDSLVRQESVEKNKNNSELANLDTMDQQQQQQDSENPNPEASTDAGTADTDIVDEMSATLDALTDEGKIHPESIAEEMRDNHNILNTDDTKDPEEAVNVLQDDPGQQPVEGAVAQQNGLSGTGIRRLSRADRNDKNDRLNELIKTWLADGDLLRLEHVVIAGQGDRLLGLESKNSQIQDFLKLVPAYMEKIRKVHGAVVRGDIGEVQKILTRKRFALCRDQFGASPLHLAVLHGHPEVVIYIITQFPETIDGPDNDGRTPLHYAAVAPDKQLYTILETANASKGALDRFGQTPSDYLENGQLTIRELLIKYQKKPKTTGSLRRNGVPEADLWERPPTAEIEENLTPDSGSVPSSASKNEPPLAGLMNGGASSKINDSQPEAPQILQIEPRTFPQESGQNEPLEEALDQIRTQPKEPGVEASKNSKVLKKQASQDVQESSSFRRISEEFVRSLRNEKLRLQKSFDTQMKNNKVIANGKNGSVIDSIQASGALNPKVVGSINSAKYDLTQIKDEHGRTVLHLAAAKEHSKSTFYQMLAQAPYLISERDAKYRTLRDVAVMNGIKSNLQAIDRFVLDLFLEGKSDTIRMMLLEGYDQVLSVVDSEGNDPISLLKKAGITGMDSTIHQLATIQKSRDELHTFIRNGYTEGVLRLVEQAPELVMAKSDRSRTALHLAVLFGSVEIIEKLIQADYRAVNAPDNLGRTPLHYAMAMSKMEELGRILIHSGANKTVRDVKMRTPTYYFVYKQEVRDIKREEQNLTI